MMPMQNSSKIFYLKLHVIYDNPNHISYDIGMIVKYQTVSPRLHIGCTGCNNFRGLIKQLKHS